MTEDPAARVGTLALLAAARAVSPHAKRDPLEHLAWVTSGAPFEEAGVVGFLDDLGEAIPDPGLVSGDDVAAMISRLDGGGPGFLGEQYMRTMPRSVRHARGEFFTPAWLVEHVLDRAGFGADRTLMDPMCGAGSFLVAAVARLRRSQPRLPATRLVGQVRGMDVSPLAVLMARSAYLAALAGPSGGARCRPDRPIRIPVTCTDAILSPPQESFDIIAGNPPWIGWENLSPEYRERTRGLWKYHGLFPDGGAGMRAILGRGKKDLSMLATYAVAESSLAPGGRLAFVITRTVFKSVGSGAGFRRFVLGDGTPVQILSVDDFGERAVFPGASTSTSVLTLRKGRTTRYPVRYFSWGRDGSEPREDRAEPVDPEDRTSAWLTGTASRIESVRSILGRSDYKACAGAYTGGANGVYWVRVLEQGRGKHGEELCLIANQPDAGKRKVPEATVWVERELVYPLLRASDAGRFRAEPASAILLPQDPGRRRGIDLQRMRSRYPLALRYLEMFRTALGARRDRGTRSLIQAGAPFYSIFSVSAATMSEWKVVWPRIASRVNAAVVGPSSAWPGGEPRPVIPQETCTLIPCAGREEACYLAGILNSDRFHEAAAAFSPAGGKSFGAPHLMRHIAVPRFDPERTAHGDLVSLVRGGSPTASDLSAAAAEAW